MSEKIFPTDYTDDEINAELRGLLKKVKDAQFNINTVLQVSPIIVLAQNELQKRINSNLGQKLNQLTEITDKNAETSLQGTRSANKLSKLAIIISVIGILVQVYLTLSSK